MKTFYKRHQYFLAASRSELHFLIIQKASVSEQNANAVSPNVRDSEPKCERSEQNIEWLPQHHHRLLHRRHHAVDFLFGVVEGE